MAVLLELKSVNTYYGKIHAIKDINLTINTGEIVTLIGSNGAGKTTILHTISGLIKPQAGEILFNGKPIQHLPAYKITALGLAQAPEGRQIFTNLTVKENLEMGAYIRKDTGGIKEDLVFLYNLFPILRERASQLAQTLSGGEQQMLAIARAYMSKPKLLLLDEPSLGIAPILVKTIFQAIREINQMGMSILLVEQNAVLALKISRRAYVLVNGQISIEGDSESLLNNSEIKKAYLGY